MVCPPHYVPYVPYVSPNVTYIPTTYTYTTYPGTGNSIDL